MAAVEPPKIKSDTVSTVSPLFPVKYLLLRNQCPRVCGISFLLSLPLYLHFAISAKFFRDIWSSETIERERESYFKWKTYFRKSWETRSSRLPGLFREFAWQERNFNLLSSWVINISPGNLELNHQEFQNFRDGDVDVKRKKFRRQRWLILTYWRWRINIPEEIDNKLLWKCSSWAVEPSCRRDEMIFSPGWQLFPSSGFFLECLVLIWVNYTVGLRVVGKAIISHILMVEKLLGARNCCQGRDTEMSKIKPLV